MNAQEHCFCQIFGEIKWFPRHNSVDLFRFDWHQIYVIVKYTHISHKEQKTFKGIQVMFDFLSKRFGSIFNQFGKKKLQESDLQDTLQLIVDSLLEADVPHDLAQQFIKEVKEEAVGKQIIKSLKPGDQFVKIVHDKLKQFLGGDSVGLQITYPATILVMGLQGSGKTTTIAKLAHLVEQQEKRKKRMLFASVDFYRPAAIDQLEQLSQKVGVNFYRSLKADPIEAVVDIKCHFEAQGYDLLFLDTAGRLHVDQDMLHELVTIKKLIKPTHSILILDAMTGQESLNVAKSFDQAVGFEYAILTKMDSDTRGGAAFSFRYALKKPILFVGVGEKVHDIQEFKPDRMAGRILDMGDIVTLAERAEKQIQKDEQESLYDAMSKGRLTLQDFAKQLEMVGKLGSISSLMKYLPGMGSLNISEDMVQKGELELKKFKAIIGSMTKKERVKPEILDSSRKKRVAQGAGVMVTDVNLLLSRFQESQQYVKLLSKFGRGQGFFK
jgi:signal recognition particle subunit SRP54